VTPRAFGDHEVDNNPDGNGLVYNLPLRYPGQYFDGLAWINYNHFRDYDASAGRYLQSDPIGLAGGEATFLYALASPLVMFDRLGLAPQCGSNCCENVDYGKKEAQTSCCGGVAVTCTREDLCDKWGGNDGEFCRALTVCIARHEKVHSDNHFQCSTSVRSTVSEPVGECAAWSETVRCFRSVSCKSAECSRFKRLYLNGDKGKEATGTGAHAGAIPTRDRFCRLAGAGP
jgi:RHS repeat-associated protein